jgi:hypothetical protein
MGDLNSEVNKECSRFQATFNGIFELQPNDRETALGTLLKEILPVDHKPKWALFPLYVIYELLYRFSRGNTVEKVAGAYTSVVSLVSYIIQDQGMQGPAKIDAAMISSFLGGTLRSGRGFQDKDEFTDFKNRGLCKLFTIGPTTVTFDTFLLNVAGRSSGGKSRRRRHRRFRSKKRGCRTLRNRRKVLKNRRGGRGYLIS